MRLAHLNALKALESTLRLGSFKAAASELGVTTAAVGQRIRGLEDTLERRLFERTGTGVRANDSALAVQQKLTAGFVAIEEALSQLSRRRSSNSLAVTMPSSFAENWFADRLSEFYRTNARIDLRLDASNRMVDLLREDFDFAIRYCQPVESPCLEKLLFADYVLPVCTPEFAERYGLRPSLRSLLGVPLVHLDERTQDPRWPDWGKWGEAFAFDADGLGEGLHLTDFNSGIQIALGGQGLVLCGLVEAFDAIGKGLLAVPFGRTMCYPTGYRYRLVSVEGRRLSQVQLQFREWMIAMGNRFDAQLNAFLAR